MCGLIGRRVVWFANVGGCRPLPSSVSGYKVRRVFFPPRLSVFSHVLVLASILIVVDLVFCGRASSICSDFASK